MPKGHKNIDTDLWRFVTKTDECWGWTAACDKDGYGIFSLGGRSVRAHRLAWQLSRGPIPPQMEVCHRCDNPPCTRLDHLFLGTTRDNKLDSMKKGRHATGDRTGAHNRTSWNPARGTQHGRHKLTEKQVIAIKTALRDGAIGRQLARQYGVDAMTISFIKTGRNWSHVHIQ